MRAEPWVAAAVAVAVRPIAEPPAQAGPAAAARSGFSHGKDRPMSTLRIPLLLDAENQPVLDPQGNRVAVLQFMIPEPLLPALCALCDHLGCVTPEGEAVLWEAVRRGLRLLELLAARKARGDERVTVLWNEGQPQPSGIVLATQARSGVAGARS